MRTTQRQHRRTPQTRGFSLAELVVTIGILTLTLTGVLVAFVGAITLNEDSAMTSKALDAAMSQVETVRMQAINDFTGVPGLYGGALPTAAVPFVFRIPGPTSAPNAYATTSAGALTINQPNPADQFYVITAKVCWQGRGGRIMGEDRNLNGALDAGEDLNGDNELNCPVDLVTTVARRN